MFHRVPFFLPLLYPNLIWRIPTVEKELYLTFDDGPVPGPTEFVLDTLDKHKSRATFFCSARLSPRLTSRAQCKEGN